MPDVPGALRRLLLAPPLAHVGFERRGFDVPPSAAADRLQAVPRTVVCGFEWAIAARGQAEIEQRVHLVDPELRGFAYEGAIMALCVRDAMGRGRGWGAAREPGPVAGPGSRAAALLRGPARPHVFLAYIGVGFALARLPRPLWKKAAPDLTGADYPQMSWLAVDGYGFDRAYFDTRRWVDEQRVPAPYPWEGAPGYFPRAVDQGVGRALWFVHGGRAAHVTAAVGRFAERRQGDLWSGVGLAAAFAGGCAPADLAALRHAAGAHRAELAQGAVFAVKARSYAGLVPEHTRAAAEALAGLTAEAAVALADDSAVPAGGAWGTPAYELWRRNVRDRVTTGVS
ncbi:DUF1702 family protein [Streptomyces sp. G45]|uniref:DUF1702 family protein n=1 Tax=Streptomyces sp. G45 TaxID=3406627 RepID=UPI003C2006EC